MNISISRHGTHDGLAITTTVTQDKHELSTCSWFKEWKLDGKIYDPDVKLFNKVRDVFGITWTKLQVELDQAMRNAYSRWSYE
jgi:hypothetical protein